MTPKQVEVLADIEGVALGLLFGYETLAILLRKTRWTDKVPPITRKIIQLPEYVEDAILSAFKLHFIWHRRTQ